MTTEQKIIKTKVGVSRMSEKESERITVRPRSLVGGKRPGAGRRKGSPNKVTEAMRRQALATGHTPLEVMSRVMNDLLKAADLMHPASYLTVDRKVVDRLCLLERAAEVAAKAAPYLHPRLQAIEHSGKDGGAIHHEATLHATLSAEESYLRMVQGKGAN